MKRSTTVKFPYSVQLFKFCQKVLMDQKGSKIHDQEVGEILSFNPSDCSHWKRGEKNVKSVFALSKLSSHLSVEVTLLHDIVTGQASLDEAYYEFIESRNFKSQSDRIKSFTDESKLISKRQKVDELVNYFHSEAEFETPPLYLPEIFRFLPYITSQPIEMMDKLSRVLRVKPGQYVIQFKKAELKPQTRMSIVKDLARIIFEAERSKFPDLGQLDKEFLEFEELYFVANLLIPRKILWQELSKMDSRKNIVAELSTLFWAPKFIVGYQLQNMLKFEKNQLDTEIQKTSMISSSEMFKSTL